MMAWVVEGLYDWFVAGSPGFLESSGNASQTVSHYFSISSAICFWSAWKGKVVNVVEVLNDEIVVEWERLRLGTYSKEGLVSVSEMTLRSGGGGGMR